ncbi:MAG: hypothetical protein KIT22_15000, partial [Verrucomicrobiae bacterium]|nr:hypothetical protein [Verrucomicrobiae bacterium]
GGAAELSRVFHVTEATTLDEELPDSDLSGWSTLFGRITDAGQFGERKIVVKFPQRIRAAGWMHLGCPASAFCGVAAWAPDYGNADVSLRAYAYARAIDSFNGLEVSDLNWTNRGDLSLGASLDASKIAQCYATNVAEAGLSKLASGIYDSAYSPDQAFCSLRYHCGGGVEMEGVLIELAMSWSNVWYYYPGRMEATLEIGRGDTDGVWSFFGFYNPT